MTKSRTGLIIGIAGGIVLIAAAVVLILTLGGGASVTGPWHSEDLNQLLRFHDDNTVVIRTSAGDCEAAYIFDKSSGKGVITLKGEAVPFSLKGDSLLLSSGGAENAFTRGEMEVAAAVSVAAPSPSVSEVNTAASAAQSAKPSAPKPAASSAPESAEPSASVSAEPSQEPSEVTSIDPGAIHSAMIGANPNDNIIGNIAGETVVGTWLKDTEHNRLLFFQNGSYEYDKFDGISWGTMLYGTYTFNPLTGKGICSSGVNSDEFTVDGNVLTWDGDSFYRQ